MRLGSLLLLTLSLMVGGLACARPVQAYSVLAHEAVVDTAWDDLIVPILRQRFPRTSPEDLRTARAYAYGGSVLQDLGYYPFGSHLFTNLVHYVRSGDFVTALIRDARDVNEYAFAIGALAHYVSDNQGHPRAVNRAVPMAYPKLRARFGDEVLYAESPARHVMVEFAFDVSQVAAGAYRAAAYRDFIGFEVAKRVLEQAFLETYSLELKDLFFDEDLAIGTYRHAVGKTIPELTVAAWRDKHDELLKKQPGLEQNAFIYTLSPEQYDREFGTTYRKPGFFARIIVFVAKVIPKFGPFRTLAFEPLNADTERLFLDSVAACRTTYRTLLGRLRSGPLQLTDTDLDTGQTPERSRNPLVNKTYEDLREKLEKRGFKGASPELRSVLNAHFTGTQAVRPKT